MKKSSKEIEWTSCPDAQPEIRCNRDGRNLVLTIRMPSDSSVDPEEEEEEPTTSTQRTNTSSKLSRQQSLSNRSNPTTSKSGISRSSNSRESKSGSPAKGGKTKQKRSKDSCQRDGRMESILLSNPEFLNSLITQVVTAEVERRKGHLETASEATLPFTKSCHNVPGTAYLCIPFSTSKLQFRGNIPDPECAPARNDEVRPPTPAPPTLSPAGFQFMEPDNDPEPTAVETFDTSFPNETHSPQEDRKDMLEEPREAPTEDKDGMEELTQIINETMPAEEMETVQSDSLKGFSSDIKIPEEKMETCPSNISCETKIPEEKMETVKSTKTISSETKIPEEKIETFSSPSNISSDFKIPEEKMETVKSTKTISSEPKIPEEMETVKSTKTISSEPKIPEEEMETVKSTKTISSEPKIPEEEMETVKSTKTISSEPKIPEEEMEIVKSSKTISSETKIPEEKMDTVKSTKTISSKTKIPGEETGQIGSVAVISSGIKVQRAEMRNINTAESKIFSVDQSNRSVAKVPSTTPTKAEEVTEFPIPLLQTIDPNKCKCTEEALEGECICSTSESGTMMTPPSATSLKPAEDECRCAPCFCGIGELEPPLEEDFGCNDLETCTEVAKDFISHLVDDALEDIGFLDAVAGSGPGTECVCTPKCVCEINDSTNPQPTGTFIELDSIDLDTETNDSTDLQPTGTFIELDSIDLDTETNDSTDLQPTGTFIELDSIDLDTETNDATDLQPTGTFIELDSIELDTETNDSTNPQPTGTFIELDSIDLDTETNDATDPQPDLDTIDVEPRIDCTCRPKCDCEYDATEDDGFQENSDVQDRLDRYEPMEASSREFEKVVLIEQATSTDSRRPSQDLPANYNHVRRSDRYTQTRVELTPEVQCTSEQRQQDLSTCTEDEQVRYGQPRPPDHCDRSTPPSPNIYHPLQTLRNASPNPYCPLPHAFNPVLMCPTSYYTPLNRYNAPPPTSIPYIPHPHSNCPTRSPNYFLQANGAEVLQRTHRRPHHQHHCSHHLHHRTVHTSNPHSHHPPSPKTCQPPVMAPPQSFCPLASPQSRPMSRLTPATPSVRPPTIVLLPPTDPAWPPNSTKCLRNPPTSNKRN